MEQPGGYGKAYHRTFHDPCKVRAAVFDDGKKRVALVGLDALFIRRPTVLAVRKAIQSTLRHPARGRADRAPRTRTRPARRAWSCPASTTRPRRWSRSWPTRSRLCRPEVPRDGRASRSSRRSARPTPARPRPAARVGKGIEDKVAFNRRFRMKNGLSITHPGQGNPDIIEPAGPVDPEVGVVGACERQGRAARLHRQLRLPRHDATRAASRPTTSTTWRR